jgi:putative protease
MKSEYYLATVINAYRRALDEYYEKGESYKQNPLFQLELDKTAHREFTTAYFYGKNDRTVNYDDSQSKGTHKFMAQVLDYDQKDGYALIEMRNRFKIGDVLEVLSPSDSLNKRIKVEKLTDLSDKPVEDAKLVQQKLKLYTSVRLQAGDILRKEYE